MRSMLLLAGLVALAGFAPPPAGAEDKKPAAKVEFPDFVDHIRVAGQIQRVDTAGEGESKEVTGFAVRVVTVTRVPRGRSYHEQTNDYTYSLGLHENAQVRWAVEPKKLDAKGKRANYTPAEKAELKSPAGFPGFAATRADLAKGQRVEVQLLRPKAIKAESLTDGDYKVKYVVIAGEPPPRKPPEDKTDEKKPAEKKPESKKK